MKSVVGQDGILDGILRGDCQSPLFGYRHSSGRPIANRPQINNLPHKVSRDKIVTTGTWTGAAHCSQGDRRVSLAEATADHS